MLFTSTISIDILIFVMIAILELCAAIDAANEEKGASGRSLPKAATFHFPEYAYKETSKNEIAYHEFEVACEHHSLCENLEGVQKKACVRRCISYSCYQDIYAFDELEEGEIDVRLNSFKGCVIQRTGKTNRAHGDHKQLLQRLQLAEILHELQWKFSNFVYKFIY